MLDLEYIDKSLNAKRLRQKKVKKVVENEEEKKRRKNKEQVKML